jgi:hypothetical protein
MERDPTIKLLSCPRAEEGARIRPAKSKEKQIRFI